MTQRKLKLGAFIQATGHHIAAWRHPGSQADSGTNIDHYQEVAQLAERGLFDLVFSRTVPAFGRTAIPRHRVDTVESRISSR